jgi:putative lipoprotein
MQAGPASVTGTVTYRQRSALPPDAVVEVELLDVSRADALATRLGRQEIATNGRQVPIPFEITYDPAAVDPRHSYAVGARILVGGRLRFINDTRHPVLTRGAPSTVEVVVVPVSEPKPPPSDAR